MALFKIQDLKVKKKDLITADRWNGLVDLLSKALDGPAVVSPLIMEHGAIGLGQDYQLYCAKTTATIPARVGTAWKSGACSFLTLDATGTEAILGGYPTFTGWNYTGAAIPSGSRVWVAWAYEKWVILFGDCSGVS